MNTEFKFTKIQLSISLIVFLFFTVTGATYAYFSFAAENTGTITGNVATVNLTLNVTKVFPTLNSDNTGVMVPQLSVSGNNSSPLSNALKNGCVDGNGNVVCQVYNVHIKNDGGSAIQVVDGFISFYGDSDLTTDVSISMPNLKWKLISSVDATNPSDSVLGTAIDLEANFDDNVFANDVKMVTNSEFDYNIIIWINETDEDQSVDEGQDFFAKVQFNSSNGTGVTSTFVA